MKIFIKYKPLIFSSLLSLSLIYPFGSISAQVSNQGQAVRISEAEIQLQDKYLAAIGQQQIGKMEGAAKLFQEVLEKNPKCDACAFQLTRIYTTMGDNQKAIDFAKRALAKMLIINGIKWL